MNDNERQQHDDNKEAGGNDADVNLQDAVELDSVVSCSRPQTQETDTLTHAVVSQWSQQHTGN